MLRHSQRVRLIPPTGYRFYFNMRLILSDTFTSITPHGALVYATGNVLLHIQDIAL